MRSPVGSNSPTRCIARSICGKDMISEDEPKLPTKPYLIHGLGFGRTRHGGMCRSETRDLLRQFEFGREGPRASSLRWRSRSRRWIEPAERIRQVWRDRSICWGGCQDRLCVLFVRYCYLNLRGRVSPQWLSGFAQYDLDMFTCRIPICTTSHKLRDHGWQNAKDNSLSSLVLTGFNVFTIRY